MPTRREFGWMLSAGAVAATVAHAQTADETADDSAAQRARLRTQLLELELGPFTPEDRAKIREDLERYLPYLDRLHSVELTNADEPDFIFIAESHK